MFPIVVRVDGDEEAWQIIQLKKYFVNVQGAASLSSRVVLSIANALLASEEVKECLPHYSKVYSVVYGLHTGIMFDWCVPYGSSVMLD